MVAHLHTKGCFARALTMVLENETQDDTISDGRFMTRAYGGSMATLADEYLADGTVPCRCEEIISRRLDATDAR